MTRTKGAGRLLVATAITCVSLNGALDAQSVRGHLRAGPGRSALAGARIALVDGVGQVTDETLTDAAGAFALTAPSVGSYRLVGRAPGYRDVETTATVAAEPLRVDLTTEALAVDLPTRRLEPDRRRRLPGREAERVAALWDEVGKALEALVLDEDLGLHGQERVTWTRSLAPDDLRPLDERVTRATGFVTGRPYRSPPAEELAQFGYIQGGEGEGWSFFAPDARTLLAPSFASSHCLGYAPDGPEAGWVGLTFRPRFEGGMDVEGTLWIDAGTLGPRRLEFGYTDLPWSVTADEVGGRVEYHRLEGGPWVVRRWWIRSPRVGVTTVRLTPWDQPRQRFGVTTLVEDGGEILRIQAADGHIERLEASPGGS